MLLASPTEPQSCRRFAWLAITTIAYLSVLRLPTPAGLSASGQVALGLLVLVVIL